MKFRPLGDRVLVLPLESDDKIAGFKLPDSAKEKECKAGIVLAVGPRTVEGLNKGDKVVYGAYAGIELLIEGQLLVRMREGEIDGVLDDCQHKRFDVSPVQHPDLLDPAGQKYKATCIDCGQVSELSSLAITEGTFDSAGILNLR